MVRERLAPFSIAFMDFIQTISFPVQAKLPIKSILRQFPLFILAAFFGLTFLTKTTPSFFHFFKQSRSPKETFIWREIFSDFYVFSIRYTVHNDSPQLHAVTIGNALDEIFWNTTVCLCRYNNGSQQWKNHSVQGQLQRLPGSHRFEGRTWTAARLKCPFPLPAQTFKVVVIQCSYPDYKLTGSVAFSTPIIPKYRVPKLTFAHCGPPLHSGLDRPALIVEYIEYYRLMGIDTFYWYDVSVSNRTRKVFDYYEEEGVMDVTKWNLPAATRTGIHYYGQLALLYDCLLKSSLTHDYTVFCKYRTCPL